MERNWYIVCPKCDVAGQLAAFPLYVGRQANAVGYSLVLAEPYLSRSQFALDMQEGRMWYFNQSETNPCLVDGAEAVEAELVPETVHFIEVGDLVIGLGTDFDMVSRAVAERAAMSMQEPAEEVLEPVAEEPQPSEPASVVEEPVPAEKPAEPARMGLRPMTELELVAQTPVPEFELVAQTPVPELDVVAQMMPVHGLDVVAQTPVPELDAVAQTPVPEFELVAQTPVPELDPVAVAARS